MPAVAPIVVDREAYEAIVCDPIYRHFTNIPRRIVRCLDYFGIETDRDEAAKRLLAYYLFVGVIDEAIDSGEGEVRATVLSRFRQNHNSLVRPTTRISIATEVLKQYIDDDIYPTVAQELEELYLAVVAERLAETIDEYIPQREIVGTLTAELSYQLIRVLLKPDRQGCRSFLQQVGAVGCLVDSVIDFRADARLGLFSFKPSVAAFLKLLGYTLRKGLSISIRHPTLWALFLEAIVDNVRDRFRVNSGTAFGAPPSTANERSASVI